MPRNEPQQRRKLVISQNEKCKNCNSYIRKGWNDLQTWWVHDNGKKECEVIVTYAETKGKIE